MFEEVWILIEQGVLQKNIHAKNIIYNLPSPNHNLNPNTNPDNKGW